MNYDTRHYAQANQQATTFHPEPRFQCPKRMTHLLNFKAELAPMVESGEKRQTFRPPRKRPIRAGDTLKLYTGLRTKKARLLGTAVCTQVVPMEIREVQAFQLYEDGLPPDELSCEEMKEEAEDDGFPSWAALWQFFDEQYPPGSKNRTPDGNGIILDVIRW